MHSICDFCISDPLIFYKTSYKTLERKYFEAFNFYFAKPVNEILANIGTTHVIMFKDYLFYDDDCNEYLKRFYNKDEIRPRVRALADFYYGSYKITKPNLCPVEQFKIIQKRNNKLDKLFIMKNNKENKEKALEEKDNELILENLLSEQTGLKEESRMPLAEKFEDDKNLHNPRLSFDSSDHDIYNPDFSTEVPNLKPEKQTIALGKIKARSNSKTKESTHPQTFDNLFEEIIKKQKKTQENPPLPTKNTSLLSSCKFSSNFLKDISENRISDLSELLNLHEMLRASNEKLDNKLKHPKQPTLSSQLTQDTTKRTPANTTIASNERRQTCQPLTHNKLISQISQLCKQTGSLDRVFDLIKKLHKPANKKPPAQIQIGSLTDRVVEGKREEESKEKKIRKINMNLLERYVSPYAKKGEEEEKRGKSKSKRLIETRKPPKIAIRSLNCQIYNSLRNKSFTNGSSKSHIETQRSEERQLKGLKKVDITTTTNTSKTNLHIPYKKSKAGPVANQKNTSIVNLKVKKNLDQIQKSKINENLAFSNNGISQFDNEEIESSYGFWTSRSNKPNEEPKRIFADREDYYGGHNNKAKTDRFCKDKWKPGIKVYKL